jgi:hypothetical protein
MAINTARLAARAAAPAAVLAGTAALALGSVPAQAGVSAHHAGDPSVVFTFTGSEQPWVVPSGVTSVTITAIGAAGGSTDTVNTGGDGASVFSTVPVFPGEILYVNVGGVGGNGSPTGPSAPGGFNGGGTGGFTGAGGGGASDVRTIATGISGSPGSRLVVAAGGGGAGSDGTCGSTNGGGGNGGPQATVGADGGGCPATPVSATGGHGGQPGGSAAGGTHGAAGTPTASTIDATDGVQGTGGTGGTQNSGPHEADGGGGGGGAYGGGGGGNGGWDGTHAGGGGGGGGGSSLGTPLGPTTAAASVTISYSVSALAITTSSPLPGGTVGTHYSKTLSASGGSGGNTWSKTSGTLPAGLSLSSAGVISGTPTTSGTKTFTIQVTDSAAATASTIFSLTIGAHADLAISLTHLGTFRHAKTGQYQMLVTNTGSGATSRTTSVTLSLPRGMKMDFGGSGTWWQCHKDTSFSVCTRSGKINAQASTTITARVKISAPAGSFRTATATVSPADSTPGDNTDRDAVKIHSN